MNLFPCFSRYKSKRQQKLLYQQLTADDSLAILHLMVTDKSLKLECRRKIAEAVIAQKRHTKSFD